MLINVSNLSNNKADQSVVSGIDGRVAQVELDLNGKAAVGEEGAGDYVPAVSGLKERVGKNEGDIVEVLGKLRNVYTKNEADNLLSGKANSADVYDKDAIDALLEGKASTSDSYLKSETYTKTEVNSALDNKLDKSVYDSYVADKIISDAELKAYADKAVEALAKGSVKDNADAIEDLEKRIDNVANIMNFRGVVELDDDGNLPLVDAEGNPYEVGDVVLCANAEYVFVQKTQGDKTVYEWEPFGDSTVLGALE